MKEYIGIIISVISLGVSWATFWLVHFRRGRLKMTRPTMVAFLFDSSDGFPKIYLRALLYSTAVRGQVIESLYLKVQFGQDQRVFDFWAYGESEKLVKGSGLFVNQSGVSSNHHFVMRRDGQGWPTVGGDCVVEVFAIVDGSVQPLRLHRFTLSLTGEHITALVERTGWVNFNWRPDSQSYTANIERAPWA